MNHKQYIDALKRALRGLDRKTRDEIVLEIEAHAQDQGSEASLIEQFGPPSELASRYLEGETLKTSLGKRVAGGGKIVLTAIGAIAVLITVAVALLIGYWNKDAFDYANERAQQLDGNTGDWQSVDWTSPVDIEVTQARAVFYWRDQNNLGWHCKNGADFQEGVLTIRHADCLVFLPRQVSAINATQANIVLVRPQANTHIDLVQSRLRIADNSARYRFDIDAVHSDVDNFVSDDSAAITIAVNTTESEVEAYEY